MLNLAILANLVFLVNLASLAKLVNLAQWPCALINFPVSFFSLLLPPCYFLPYCFLLPPCYITPFSLLPYSFLLTTYYFLLTTFLLSPSYFTTSSLLPSPSSLLPYYFLLTTFSFLLRKNNHSFSLHSIHQYAQRLFKAHVPNVLCLFNGRHSIENILAEEAIGDVRVYRKVANTKAGEVLKEVCSLARVYAVVV